MLPSDKFFQLVGTRWKLAKAICIHESNGDWLTPGDSGDAQGMFQLHAKFAQDYAIPAGNPLAIILRGEPYMSITIMRTFLFAHQSSPDRDVIGVFHNGQHGWDIESDKDGYVAAVLIILARL